MANRRWITAHHRDRYVRQAVEQGYRSRAIYKLEEMDRRHHLLRRGMHVLDLGAAPGGWSQYSAHKVGAEGRVWAVDQRPVESLTGVQFLQLDLTLEADHERLLKTIPAASLDLVMADLAPMISGVRARDDACALALAEQALAIALSLLRLGGHFLVKIFQGEEAEAFRQCLALHFAVVKHCKPAASRPRSRELYRLALGLRAPRV